MPPTSGAHVPSLNRDCFYPSLNTPFGSIWRRDSWRAIRCFANLKDWVVYLRCESVLNWPVKAGIRS